MYLLIKSSRTSGLKGIFFPSQERDLVPTKKTGPDLDSGACVVVVFHVTTVGKIE